MDEAGHMRQWECIDLPDFNFSVESIEEDDPLALSPFRSTPPKPEGVEISSDSESESTEHALGPSTSRRAPPLNQLRSLLHLMHQSLSDDILNNNRNRLGLGPSTALTGVDQPISIFRSSSTSTNTSTEEEYPPPCTSTPQNLAGNSLTSFETIKKYRTFNIVYYLNLIICKVSGKYYYIYLQGNILLLDMIIWAFLLTLRQLSFITSHILNKLVIGTAGFHASLCVLTLHNVRHCTVIWNFIVTIDTLGLELGLYLFL